MDRDITEVLEAALKLPPEGRAALAQSLLDSLDTDVDEGAEAAWRSEIARRVKELDSGAVTPIPWPEVRAKLIATLNNER